MDENAIGKVFEMDENAIGKVFLMDEIKKLGQ